MAKQRAQAPPTPVSDLVNHVALEGMTPAVETIQAFAREIDVRARA